jgi:hypothetical protein
MAGGVYQVSRTGESPGASHGIIEGLTVYPCVAALPATPPTPCSHLLIYLRILESLDIRGTVDTGSVLCAATE